MTNSSLKASIMMNAVIRKDLKFAFLAGITDGGIEKHVAARPTGLII
jgi:hypothetical protein